MLPIHDHFLVKTLDLMRPGGMAVFLTSHYTLDKQDDRARQVMFERADLVAAVRLPSGAHRRTAGTEVVTDVLVLRRRREGESPGDDRWLRSSTFSGEVRLNDYNAANPDHVLGEPVVGHGLYGEGLEGPLDEVDVDCSGLEVNVASTAVFLPVPYTSSQCRNVPRTMPRSSAIPRSVAPGVDSYKSTAWRRNSSE